MKQMIMAYRLVLTKRIAVSPPPTLGEEPVMRTLVLTSPLNLRTKQGEFAWAA
jgi:hypothetical protein